jgi:hypothetical protein
VTASNVRTTGTRSSSWIISGSGLRTRGHDEQGLFGEDAVSLIAEMRPPRRPGAGPSEWRAWGSWAPSIQEYCRLSLRFPAFAGERRFADMVKHAV